MDVIETGVFQFTKYIEVFSLSTLVNEVENANLSQKDVMDTEKEHYKEMSQDAA